MPREKRPEPRSRLSMELSESVRQRLEQLRVATGADSLTELIRRSLALHEMIVEHVQRGGVIILRDQDSARETQLEILL